MTEPKQAAVQSEGADTGCVAQPARIVLAPQRKGYGVCGAAPPQLYVTTVQDLNITSIADAGAVALNSSVADVPCPGAPSLCGASQCSLIWWQHGGQSTSK